MSRANRILITGAGGFVGGHLLPKLAAAFPAATLLPAAFDLRDPAAIDAGIRDAAPDVVIHLAAISAIPAARQEPDAAWTVNLDGSRRLGQAILTHAPDAFLLYISSADVYGASFLSGLPLDEAAVLAPMNVYGATKAAADLTLGAMAADGLRVVRLRPFNHTGPGQSDQFVVAALAHQLARIAAGRQPPVLNVGNLDSQRDFLDVADVCAAYIACITHQDRLPPGTILNIASGQPRRIGDILEDLVQLAGLHVEVHGEPARIRATEIRTACGNASRAHDRLAWHPAVPWHHTLATVLEYWHHKMSTENP